MLKKKKMKLSGHQTHIAAQVEREILNVYEQEQHSIIWFHCSNRQTRKLIYTVLDHYRLPHKTLCLKAYVGAAVPLDQHYCPSADCELPNGGLITDYVTHIYKMKKAIVVESPFPRCTAERFLPELDRIPCYRLLKISYHDAPLDALYKTHRCAVVADFGQFTQHFALFQMHCRALCQQARTLVAS